EGVTRLDLSGREATLEPGASLRGGAMGEGLGVDATGRRALNAIVAHRRRGVQPFLNVSLMEQTTLLGRVPPDAGEAIGLQLEPNGDGICIAGILALQATRLRVDAQKMLYMMPELVRQDISLREITGRTKAALKLVVEGEIDVHLLIERTIERAHRRLGSSTSGLCDVAEEHELRVIVRHASLSENRAPCVLHVIEHKGDELYEPIFRGRARNLAIRRCNARAVRGCAAGHKITAENQTQYEHNEGAADSHSRASAGK